MKVLFINDSISQRNWGDRAAAASLRAMIEARGGEIIAAITERDLTVSSFCKGPAAFMSSTEDGSKEALKRFLPPVALELRRRLVPDERRSRRSRFVPTKWEEYPKMAKVVLGSGTPWPELLRVFEDMDLAVIHGDGCMTGNGVVPRTELFLSYLIKKHYGKPVIIVNHTTDFGHPDLRRSADGVYPLFDDVVFRDPLSEEVCGSMCDGRFVPDTGFWFRPASPEVWHPLARRPTFFDVWPDRAAFDPAKPYLCLGGSSILGTLEKPQILAAKYAELIDELRKVYPGQIVLTASDWVDQEAFRPIAARDGLPLVAVSTPVQQAADILGNADIYIGGRWHPGIFALCGGTPVVSLSAKTFKMKALLEMADLPLSNFDALDPAREKNELTQRVRALLDEGSVLRDRLRAWAQEAGEKSWGNVAYLERWTG